MFALIPARGGSKGIPGKNIRLLNGKPLIHYTIDAARKVFDDEQIIVSTDDENIIRVVEETGLKVPFIRPSELAQDTSSTREVILHAISYLESIGQKHDVVSLLQPTSPFRTGEHIKNALSIYNHELDMVVSVKMTDSNPYYVLYEEDKEGFLTKSKKSNFTRRQDCPDVWEFNGAIYIIRKSSIEFGSFNKMNKIRKYVMSSIDSIDIDSELDWNFAEMIITKGLFPGSI